MDNDRDEIDVWFECHCVTVDGGLDEIPVPPSVDPDLRNFFSDSVRTIPPYLDINGC